MQIGSDGTRHDAMTPPPERIRVLGGEHTAVRGTLRAAFELAPLPMALVGPDDRVRYANPAHVPPRGLRPRRAGDRTVAALTHPDERDPAAAGRRVRGPGHGARSRPSRPASSGPTAARSGRRSAARRWPRRATGPRWSSRWSTSREHKHAEQSLARSNAELGSFAYLAAHELKSPLQALSGFAACSSRAYGPQLEPGARECVTWIADGAAGWTP